jgi:TonB family protein
MLLAGVLLTSVQMGWVTTADIMQQYEQQSQVAIKSGDPQAEACYGLYQQGINSDVVDAETLHLYQYAASKGNLQARLQLAKLSMEGKGGVKQNKQAALDQLHTLIKQGYMSAATYLGETYLENENPKASDYKIAFTWFEKGYAGGDPFAAIQIGNMYANGLGVPKNHAIAKQWADKAAGLPVRCLASFFDLSDDVLKLNAQLPEKLSTKMTGVTAIYRSEEGKALHPRIIIHSNDSDFDNAWLSALKTAKLPHWPENFHPKNNVVGFGASTRYHIFLTRVHYAVSNVLVMPKSLILNGIEGIDNAVVEFEYLDGKASHIKIEKSSGNKAADAAVLTAVSNAKLPAPLEEYVGKKLKINASIDFKRLMSFPGTQTPQAAEIIN